MRMRYYAVFALVGVGMLQLLQSGTWAAEGYTIQDISVADTIKAAGPNLSGQAAIRSGFVSARGFLSAPGMVNDVGQLPGGRELFVNGINDAGIVVGAANTVAGMRPCRNPLAGTPPPGQCPVSTTHAVMWTKSGGLRDLGVLPGDTASQAYAVNNPGAVVGYSSGPRGMRAFLWTPKNGFTELGVLPGGDSSKAFGVNDRGLVVGSSGSSVGTRAVLWTLGRIQDLGTLPGDTTSEAVAINNQGTIVGYSTGPLGVRPFLWTASSGMQALPTLPGSNLVGRALGIEDSGKVVGSSGNFPGVHAVIWDSTGIPQDLNKLVTLPVGLVLMQAVGINARGQILVLGRDGSDVHGYHEGPNRALLLTPS